jgi:hypothetical protein
MKYVSVLTPPLLVCVAFLIAVIAFLRHEMGGRRRSSEDRPPEENSNQEPILGRDPDTHGRDVEATDRRDDN